MRQTRNLLWAAALLLLVQGCASTPAPTAPERRATGNLEAQLAGMLVGRWQGATPGNELQLALYNVLVQGLDHPYDLFLRVSGKFGDTNVLQQGYVHLDASGQDIFLGYIPHFDVTASPASESAGRFTSSEVAAACGFYLSPKGDGFAGETRGGPSCAFAVRGATGKWYVEIEPGTLVLRQTESGETLRFRKVSS